MTTYENGLFIFRRDLRIIDNNGLNEINKICKNVHTIFIFTPEQVSESNKFKSNNAVQFMIESLDELSKDINNKGGQLNCYYDDNNKVIEKYIKNNNINIVCFNFDITPYSIKRDQSIAKLCKSLNVNILCCHDYYLYNVGSIKTQTGNTYQKFTPYYNSTKTIKIDKPKKSKIKFKKVVNTFVPNLISLSDAMKKFTVVNPNILVNGGRKEGIKLLRRAKKTQTKYIKTRNDLSGSTSQLSAFIKFGCVSIREVYHEMKEIKDFSRQLVWRDFYANIMFEYSHVMGKPMKLRYENIKWDNNMIWFKAWCNGKTGFPIVDAGMTELNTTGYCHNRSRLIVMSFLIKIMFIDWRKGEKYFATQLIDYDPSSNNGNTQWVAGSGADSQMYNRIFNPWTQAKTYDPYCKYIKKWLPQLKDVPNSDIFNWDTKWKDYSHVKYIKPICDYKKQRVIVLKSYTNALFVSK